MVKKLVTTICLSLLTIAISRPCQAQDFKPYIGAGAGLFVLDFTASGVTGINNKDVFGGFGTIGFDYGDFFGAELRFGSASNTSFDVISSGSTVNETVGLDYFFSYLVKLQFPAAENLRIYALLGGSSAKATAKINTPGFVFTSTNTTSVSDSSSSLSFGGGFDFKIQDRFSLGVEWVKYASDTEGFSGTVKVWF